ncbi:unnamed protein product [Rotaria sp. Silwood1]|nr:unnamed protein product [Rotaria sp. Silwood1]
MEEVSLVDPAPKESTFPERSGLLHDLVVPTDDHIENRTTVASWLIDQGKNAFSRQTLYLKLVSDGNQSNDPVRQHKHSSSSSPESDDYDLDNFVQKSSYEYVLSRNKQCRSWLCYILPMLLITSLIFLAGFGFGQIVPRHSRQPTSVQSKYASMWTNDSSKYGRINSSISNYYYEAFEVNVVIPANYSFSIESDISACCYIYNNSFHPSDPSLNLLLQDDHGDGNGQVKFIVFLQPWTTYILIVTTLSPNVTGTFLIVADGPTTVGLREIRK